MNCQRSLSQYILTSRLSARATRSRLHTHIIQDHTERAHERAVAVFDRNSGGGAAERTYLPRRYFFSSLLPELKRTFWCRRAVLFESVADSRMWMKQGDNKCVFYDEMHENGCVAQPPTRPTGSCWLDTPAGSCSWICTPDQAGSWWGSAGQGCLCILTHSQSAPETRSRRHWSRRLRWPARKNTSAALCSKRDDGDTKNKHNCVLVSFVFFRTTRLLPQASNVLRLMLNRTAVGKVLLLMKPRHWASPWWPFRAKSTSV